MTSKKSCCYNRFVDCEEHTHCYQCGWNPEVQDMRSVKNRERLKTALEKLKWRYPAIVMREG